MTALAPHWGDTPGLTHREIAGGASGLGLTSASPVADVGGNIFTRRFECSPKRSLSEQRGVPVMIRSSHNEFVVGDKQLRIDISHGRSQSIELGGSVEVALRFGPQTLACLAKLIGGGLKIVLQNLRDPGEGQCCHGSPHFVGAFSRRWQSVQLNNLRYRRRAWGTSEAPARDCRSTRANDGRSFECRSRGWSGVGSSSDGHADVLVSAR